MRQNHILAAIDIGTTKIVTIVGRLNESKKLEIIGMSKAPSRGVKRGVVLNIEEAVGSIRQTVEDVQQQVGFTIREAFVGIAGQHIKSMRNRGYILRDSYEEEIRKEDTDRLLAEMFKVSIQPGEEIIHVLPQNYVVDNETGIRNPVGMFGKRLEGNYHIVIGQTTSARTIERCVNRVGIKVHQMILEPLASSSAVLTDDEVEAGVALVDIGGGTTDVAVYSDEVIKHTAVIPFGGNVITKDVMDGCSILGKHAEQLKIQYGSALGDLAEEAKVVAVPGISGREPKEVSVKSLAYIIQSRMEEILDAVVFQIEQSDCLDKLNAGIVLTGGGSVLRHLPQLVKYRTGLDVRIGLPDVHLARQDLKEVIHPMYSTSVGLLLKGFEALPEGGHKPEPEPASEPVLQNEEEHEERQGKTINNIVDKFKNAISTIFDDGTDNNM